MNILPLTFVVFLKVKHNRKILKIIVDFVIFDDTNCNQDSKLAVNHDFEQ